MFLTNPPGPWQSYLNRPDNKGLSLMEVKNKYMQEQLLFENYMSFQMQQQMLMSQQSSGGGPSPSTISPVIIVDADAQAFITAAAITDSTQQAAIDNLVIGLKADSLWTSMYAIYPLVGGTASQHKYNLKDPRDLNAAYRLQFNGGMTHSSNGILFNGVNGWADTSINTISPNSFGVYNRNTTDNGGTYIGSSGADEDVNESNYYLNSFTGYLTNLFSPVYVSAYMANTSGLNVMTAGQSFYKNGLFKVSGTAFGPNPLVPNMSIGALNRTYGIDNSTHSNQQIAFAFMGSISLNGTQNTNLYNRVQTFQTALSRQV
jgi:hypothetical protein